MDKFNALFRRYYARCVAFAQSFVFDKAEAEAIASDALLVLWQKRESGSVDLDSPLPFLFGTVRNKSLNFLRGKAREAAALGDAASVEVREIELRMNTLEMCDPHKLYESDVQTLINTALESLGDKTAAVFRLSRYKGMSNREIARYLGLSEKAVEYHMTKALRELRARLKDYLPL